MIYVVNAFLIKAYDGEERGESNRKRKDEMRERARWEKRRQDVDSR